MQNIKLFQKILEQNLAFYQSQLNIIRQHHQNLCKNLEELGAALLSESQLVADNPYLMESFISYKASNREQQDKIKEELVEVEKTIEYFEEKISETFAEQKRLEIYVEKQEAKLKAKAEKKAEQEIEEVTKGFARSSSLLFAANDSTS